MQIDVLDLKDQGFLDATFTLSIVKMNSYYTVFCLWKGSIFSKNNVI